MATEHLAHMIRASAREFADETAMRHKVGGSWQSLSYRELDDRIRTAAKALLELGIHPGDKVGIFSANRPEWAIADFAVLSVGAVSVAIYATDSAKEAEYIVHDAGLRLIFVGAQVQYDKVRSFVGADETLEIVAFDGEVKIEGPHALRFADFMERGRTSKQDGALDACLERATADDVATLIYTSGTTGVPKGAILTHANFAHQFAAMDERFVVTSSDRSLCFLPLSHAYERTWSYYVFRSGAENNYLSDPKRVTEYLAEVKPTVMVSVPLLYEKVQAGVRGRLSTASPGKRRLFEWALRTGRRYHGKKILEKKPVGPLLALEYALADRLVLGKIRDIMGGPKNFLSAGGAPLSQAVEEFFFAVGLVIYQGYGLTETAPMISCNWPGSLRFGSVGKPVRDVEVRIGEGGEILVRGPNVMKGYHNKPEDTRRAFVDGWFRTGDVGELDADGFLHITDRVKDLIVTSGGKKVAPQHIEGLLKADPFTEHVVALGDRRKYLTALIVPQFAALEDYARAHAIPFSSRSELVHRPELVELYRASIEKLSADLAPYERIQGFTLLDHELTQENDELTPTQKVKRKAIAAKYAGVIEQMYRD